MNCRSGSVLWIVISLMMTTQETNQMILDLTPQSIKIAKARFTAFVVLMRLEPSSTSSLAPAPSFRRSRLPETWCWRSALWPGMPQAPNAQVVRPRTSRTTTSPACYTRRTKFLAKVDLPRGVVVV